MKIALIGTRGVPASYGGFETCVEEIGRRLVKRGHQVTVYCRSGHYRQKLKEYLGMELIYLPNLRMKSLDTLSHSFLSTFHSIRRSYDVLMVFNAANSPALLLPHILQREIAINTDGLEWKRGKWGVVGRRYYKMAEWLATRVANRIVADSTAIQEYYRKTYDTESTCIAYGAYLTRSRKPELLDKIGVVPNGYFLQVTRFEPENNPLLTINAYKKLRSDKKLVLVGGVHYPGVYSRQITSAADTHVLLPGFVYDKELLNELWCNCYAYIHGNEVGGTNPALLQSMASGCLTLAIDVDFNRDVLRDGGLYFEKSTESLSEKMQWTLDHPEDRAAYIKRAVLRIQEYYSWDRIAEQYESLFVDMTRASYLTKDGI